MFDIGWSEILVIGVIAIVVIGPKDLPKAMRTVGGVVAKMRRMARDFQRQINDAVRDDELDQLQKDMRQMGASTEADLKRGLNIPRNAKGDPVRPVASGPQMTPLTAGPTARAAIPPVVPPPTEPPLDVPDTAATSVATLEAPTDIAVAAPIKPAVRKSPRSKAAVARPEAGTDADAKPVAPKKPRSRRPAAAKTDISSPATDAEPQSVGVKP